jgi:hypothetical protein
MMAVSYSANIFGKRKKMKRSDWLRKRLNLDILDNAMITELSTRSYSLLEKKCLKLQQERDNAIKQRDNMELRFCQYILRTENEKAIAARKPHSRGLHPRVAALKGTHNKE